MAQLSANQVNTYDVYPSNLNLLPIKASTEIFKGSAVGITSGYARQLNAGDVFGGFAEQHVNNSVATDGAAAIPVLRAGIITVAISGAAVTDINKTCYALDGNTFQLTNANSAVLIGRIIRWVSTGVVVVLFSTDFQAAS